jgi:hypothetical protein
MVERYRTRRGIAPLDDLTYCDVLYNAREFEAFATEAKESEREEWIS